MTEKSETVSKYTNLEPNVAGALAYILGALTGVFFFVVEKEDKFVRFHAMQSILLGIVSAIAWTIANALISVAIGLILAPLVSLAIFAGYVFAMWKAYNKEMYELPYIGKFAKQQVEK